MSGMWEPFTERARRTIILGQEEAQRLGNNYIGTEHVLLGIVSEGESFAAKYLAPKGVTISRVRQEVEAIVGRGGQIIQTEMVFTPRAKRAIELAFETARTWNHDYIGTEHILVGLIREGEGVACRVLVNLGIDTNKLEAEIRKTVTPDTESVDLDSEGIDDFVENVSSRNKQTISHQQLVKAAATLPENVKSRLEVAIKMFKAAGFEIN